MEVKEKQLLLDTLNRLWSHYLQASDFETDDNQAASVKVCVQLGYRPRKRKSSLCSLITFRNTRSGCCYITFSTWTIRPYKMRTSIGKWKTQLYLLLLLSFLFQQL